MRQKAKSATSAVAIHAAIGSRKNQLRTRVAGTSARASVRSSGAGEEAALFSTIDRSWRHEHPLVIAGENQPK
jgi:hypothetical protein